MTKADEFIKWVEETNPDFKQRDHGEIIREFDSLTGYGQFWGEEIDDYYDETTEAYFTDGSVLILNYKGEVEYQS